MVSTLVEVGQSTLNPLETIWLAIVNYLPGIIGAIIVIIIGYLIGLLIGHLIYKLLQKWKLDEWIVKNNFSNILMNIKISKIIKELIIWGIFVVFLAPAASLIHITVLTEILTQFAIWIPKLIFGIILVIAGLIISQIIARNIHVSKKNKVSKHVSEAIQIILIVIVISIALRQIGVQVQFLENVLLVILGGVVLAFAIAIGIGLSGSIKFYTDKFIETHTHKKEVKKKK